jgi:GTP cyclohydrolase I
MSARGIRNTGAKTYSRTLRGRFEKEPYLLGGMM